MSAARKAARDLPNSYSSQDLVDDEINLAARSFESYDANEHFDDSEE